MNTIVWRILPALLWLWLCIAVVKLMSGYGKAQDYFVFALIPIAVVIGFYLFGRRDRAIQYSLTLVFYPIVALWQFRTAGMQTTIAGYNCTKRITAFSITPIYLLDHPG